MGQKTHPIGMRLGYIQDWRSTWYADSKDYAKKLNQDIKIRKFLTKNLSHASISNIMIERPSDNIKIIIHTARPGIVIGKKGEDVDKLKVKISKIIGTSSSQVHVSIEEIKKPELEAKIVSDIVAQQIEKRIAFRRAMKRAIQNTIRSGALGVKINISGRLGGAEIARVEWNREGRIPLHTLRANIDYAISQAFTTYGTIGIKVWIFKNEIKEKNQSKFKRNTSLK